MTRCGLADGLFEQPAAGQLRETGETGETSEAGNGSMFEVFGTSNQELRTSNRAFLTFRAVYSPTNVLISARKVSRCSAAQVSSRGNR